MLQNYHEIYLKPSNGSLGRGIIKANINSEGKIKFIAYGWQKIMGSAENPQELLKKTCKYRKGKAYIVQQGLNLATYKGCPFDIRIIYQKNKRDEWQIAKKFIRVAPQGSSISNLSSGGRAEKARSVFDDIYKEKELIDDKNSQLNNLCLIVASTLEKFSKQIYGELGLDIGLDETGHPWLIEVNSKPRKSTQTNFSPKIVRNSFKRPLEYAIFLAGF
jgi:glutathione synthase/RimK-type ligase-like ATP-grasp enzyme